jgi:geranylgeranylglycerol-phosphate geranylgeranyltransferase
MDMQGDLLINSNSLAIKYGNRVALRISSYIFFFVMLLTSIPFILRWLPAIYLVPIAIIDVSIAYPSFRLLEFSNDKNAGRKYIRWIYLGATLGLLVFILIRLLEA